jgi:predicted aminopeptidase
MLGNEKGEASITAWVILSVFVLLVLITLGMVGCPSYNVYNQKMEGQAILAHAQSSREVAVAEAKAKMESAALLAQADTIRAHGVARSNEIIGKSLRENEAYLKWMWISDLKDSKNQIIYVPTEAQIPILEASKR